MRHKYKRYQIRDIKNQTGQVVVILLMLMLIALSIGLAITQQSLTDVTTSTQTEQSSRAFSAAEAGIEKALTEGDQVAIGAPIPFSNDAVATVNRSALLPLAGAPYEAIEYPPIGREITAQFWMIDPKASDIISAASYTQNSFELYFGNPGITTDKPAIEVKVIMLHNNEFKTKVYYFDSDTSRSGPLGNGFEYVAGCGIQTLPTSILGDNHQFFCSKVVGPVTLPPPPPPASDPNTPCTAAIDCKLMFVRTRFLYSNENQKLAIAPIGSYSFPPQVQIYNSTGISGQSEKQIQAYKVIDVVPAWFDFVIFSINEITK